MKSSSKALIRSHTDAIVRTMRRVVQVNERGRLVGESHQNAKLTDAQVDQIRELREDKSMSYVQLARLFGVPKSTIADICKYRRRAQTPARWKTVTK